MPLYAVALRFFSLLDLTGPNLFQHDKVPVHEERSTEHICDELECQLHARTPRLINLINAFVTEWAEIPPATLQILVERFPRSVDAITAAKVE